MMKTILLLFVLISPIVTSWAFIPMSSNGKQVSAAVLNKKILCAAPRGKFNRKGRRGGRVRLVRQATSDHNNNNNNRDPLEIFGPLRFIVPLGFVAQFLFLVAAKLVCGEENLEEYGRIGDDYIRVEKAVYEEKYGEQVPITELFSIQSRGQQIWYDNVLRDLKNGGPVKPPITQP